MLGKVTVFNDTIIKMRSGEIDVNNQDLFFSVLIKGLLDKLDNDISIRNNKVPHYIVHTGDDTMFLHMRGYDNSNEILNISTEEIYSTVPRCIVNPGSIDLLPDQLSSPYAFGNLQVEYEDSLYSLVGEFRRMPIKLSCELKYYMDSYKDTLILIQQIMSKLAFVQTYNITYLGQLIKCSYKIPENFSEEHTMEIDGSSTESKLKTISLSLEIETAFPVWNVKTLASNDCRISQIGGGSKFVPVDSEGGVEGGPDSEGGVEGGPDSEGGVEGGPDSEGGSGSEMIEKKIKPNSLRLFGKDLINKTDTYEVVKWGFETRQNT